MEKEKNNCIRTVFICWRPYQIFNAINMVINNVEGIKGNSDIFISDLPAVLKYKDELVKTNIFSHVGVFNEEGKKGRWKCFLDMAFPYISMQFDALQKYPHWRKYDIIVASGFHSFFIRMANINKKAKVIFMEDGMASYLNIDIDKFHSSKFHRILKILFNTGIHVINIQKIYVYFPELISQKYHIQIGRLPQISVLAFKIVKQVFGNTSYSDSEYRKIIYLTQPMENIWYIRDDYSEHCVQNLLLLYSENVIVRIHPRHLEFTTSLNVDKNMQFWELDAARLKSDNILISIFSTASFTPFFLLDKSPIIILLYKIAAKENSSFYKNADLFVKNISKFYPSSIFTPGNMDEFAEILKNLLE